MKSPKKFFTCAFQLMHDQKTNELANSLNPPSIALSITLLPKCLSNNYKSENAMNNKFTPSTSRKNGSIEVILCRMLQIL